MTTVKKKRRGYIGFKCFHIKEVDLKKHERGHAIMKKYLRDATLVACKLGVGGNCEFCSFDYN